MSQVPPAAPERERRRGRSTPRLIGLLAGGALLVACVGLLVTVVRSDDAPDAALDTPAGSDAIGSTAPTGSTSPAAPTTGLAPTPPATTAATPAPAPTASASTTAASTATTEPNVTTSAVPTSAPTTTAQARINVLEDPLPSGMASADVQPSLAMAQRLADALAAGDWATARQLDPGLRSQSDEALEDGYGGLDQATLLLVDAEPTADGHDLLVVLIANERAGAQTSLYCAGTTVSGGTTVHQRDAALLERFPGTVGIDDVRQDEAIVEMIRQRCRR